MTEEPNLLGDYLRARRDLVSPEDADLHPFGVRRVPGLRREEVAMLAGVSADYYLRLEQGRDRNPSPQVLEALARVLRLDEAATEYLLGLGASRPRRSRRRRRSETVGSGIAKLVDTLALPAFVEGRYFDVLASNALARAISPRLRVGENRLRSVFLDPAERDLFPEWEQATVGLVAGFRESVGTDIDDPRFVELVGELSLASVRFQQVWARHDVQHRESATVDLDHPQVGDLHLNREKLAIGGGAGQLLVVYHADAGSADADKLALLASYSLEPGTASLEPGTRTPAGS